MFQVNILRHEFPQPVHVPAAQPEYGICGVNVWSLDKQVSLHTPLKLSFSI